jgi:hypothetical protein
LRGLVEVEVCDQGAEDRDVVADGGAWVWASVGGWVEALATEEVVFDELVVGVEAECLVVDVAAPGVGADHQSGDAESVTVLIGVRGTHVVVEAAPVIPGEEVAVESQSGLRMIALMMLVT